MRHGATRAGCYEYASGTQRCAEPPVSPAVSGRLLREFAMACDKPHGLVWSRLERPGLSRRRAGKSFSYRDADGKRITDAETLARIKGVVIPPAWTQVWICPDPNGHIQAIGVDARGRRQYRYHPRFREARETSKFEHMMAFAAALPKLRAQVAKDMAQPGIGRTRVLATIVHLLETTLIRVGNRAYAKENRSYGLTTLLDRHVKITGGELKFHFTGKSGKTWKLGMQDRRVARVVKSCQDLPGQHLFQYIDESGQQQAVTSADVNAYLKAISGDDITAKDFRTWTGTVLAAMALSELQSMHSQVAAKRNVRAAIEHVAERLGNTPTICRKCYVHPDIISAYLDGALLLKIRKQIEQDLSTAGHKLTGEEAAVLAFLRSRVTRELKKAA
jgi:DNA topoisomerase I